MIKSTGDVADEVCAVSFGAPSIVSLQNHKSRRDRLMKRRNLIALSAVFVTAIATLLISSQTVLVAAKNGAARAQKSDREEPPPPFYNPYPPGILPFDIDSEIARVIREVDFIEEEALAQLHALPPPTLTGQPPTLPHTGQRANVLLRKSLNFAKNMSPFKNRACGFCHMPYVGFSGPIPSVNLTMIAYPGSFHFRAGKRSAQRYPYAPFFPVLQFNEEQGLFFGGNFWDSRATGYLLRNPDAHQAQAPPVDTQEMCSPDTSCITFKLSRSTYRPLFELAVAKGSFYINTTPATAHILAPPEEDTA